MHGMPACLPACMGASRGGPWVVPGGFARAQTQCCSAASRTNPEHQMGASSMHA